MGQGLSCSERHENALFCAVHNGDLKALKAMVEEDLSVLEQTSGFDKVSALHVAAANGQIEVGF